MAVLDDAQKQQIAAKYFQLYQTYKDDPVGYIKAKAAFEQSLGDDEKAYYQSIAGFSGQEDAGAYWKRIQGLASGGAGEVGQLTTGPDGKPTSLGGQVTSQMSDLLNYLSQPVDRNSPFAQHVLQQARSGSMLDSAGRGSRGGLANLNVVQAEANALAGLEGQRLDRLGNALGMGSGRDLGLQGAQLGRDTLAENRYQFDTNKSLQQWQAEQQQRMALPAAVGGLGGMVAMGAVSNWNPDAMAAGYGGGSRGLAGIVGGAGPSWTPPPRF